MRPAAGGRPRPPVKAAAPAGCRECGRTGRSGPRLLRQLLDDLNWVAGSLGGPSLLLADRDDVYESNVCTLWWRQNS